MIRRPGPEWFDADVGPMVRPYAVVRGRTDASGPELDVITQVVAADTTARPRRGDPEYRDILRLCGRPHSVAEVAAALGLPMLVAKVLLRDLIEDGLLEYRSPRDVWGTDSIDIDTVRLVLDGIRRI